MRQVREHGEAGVELPNLPHPDAPDGTTEDDAVEVDRFGTRPELGDARDHVEVGERLGMLDVARAVKVSGSRFAYLLGDAVFLELALVRWALERLADEGFLPVVPPVLTRREALYGTAFLPTGEDQLYKIDTSRGDEDEGAPDLYLVGTSEVPLAGLHLDEIVEPPLRYAGFSTCFRREAGTYGKDTRGIFRVHQFDKVEMFSFVEPSQSEAEHERLRALQVGLLSDLGLHGRVVDIAVGDLGDSAARKYDVEVWLPGQQRYRELTSCSNCTDYQARRLRCRFRGADGSTAPVHTLNGTAVAVGRTIIALLETHQRPDGSVAIPAALQPYLGREVLTP
jgi:seryl-tRNA synthetase